MTRERAFSFQSSPTTTIPTTNTSGGKTWRRISSQRCRTGMGIGAGVSLLIVNIAAGRRKLCANALLLEPYKYSKMFRPRSSKIPYRLKVTGERFSRPDESRAEANDMWPRYKLRWTLWQRSWSDRALECPRWPARRAGEPRRRNRSGGCQIAWLSSNPGAAVRSAPRFRPAHRARLGARFEGCVRPPPAIPWAPGRRDGRFPGNLPGR